MTSQPATQVELISIGSEGVSIGDLLTETVSEDRRWLNRGVRVGDSNLGPSRPLLQVFDYIPDFFEYVELDPIEADGLENLHWVGGDGDGHDYVFGSQTQQFYVLWHDPTEFEAVADTTDEFLQWVIRKRSDHLEGCPWEVFTTTGDFLLETVWHREQVDAPTMLERARELRTWDREYVSPAGFELFNQTDEIDLRLKQEHRGLKSHFQVIAAASNPDIEAFLGWLQDHGFGKHW